MPSHLPDPVLALSLSNVQKLKDVDVDQLANLWNVFTKCKESLESGRRLENLSWRLWFREAHLLPPDVSLSDIADYTPLGTPLMSRRGSVTGSYAAASNKTLPHAVSQPTAPLFSPSISDRIVGVAEPLSDPEEGDWSSDDGEESKTGSMKEDHGAKSSASNDRGRMSVKQQSSSPEIKVSMGNGHKAEEKKAVRLSCIAAKAGLTSSSSTLAAPQQEAREVENSAPYQPGISTPTNGDRKRAVSSSSAFGSRARVKQHNTARRRRPLSFQQAIETLLLDPSKDFRTRCDVPQTAGSDSALQSTSLQSGKRFDIGVDTNKNNGEDWKSDAAISTGSHRDVEMIGLMQQSSAPADFSQPNTPSVTIVSPTKDENLVKGIQRVYESTIEPPTVITRAAPTGIVDLASEVQDANKEAIENTKAEEKKSKFFVAGQSVEDADDDEWSSASSTDSGEMRKREAVQRRRAVDREREIEKKYKEKERAKVESLFQKVPVRSASTVDVRSTGRRRSSAPLQATDKEETAVVGEEVAPVRGLLSSLFHPEEGPHPPPGQLAGRPHASAADLRQRPQRLSSSRQSKTRGVENQGSDGNPTKLTRVPSTTQVPSMGSGALKLSKSAVALPVLSTMGSRSVAKANTVSSRDAAVFDDDDDEDQGEEHDSGEMEGAEGGGAHGESEALARLNRLAHKKKERQRQGKRLSATNNSSKVKRQSTHSLNVEVSPEVNDEEMMRERREGSGGSGKRASLPMPLSTSQRAISSSHIPETSMPQTPRTTRRNMIRDELSESLRQNLLWERQSRHRMLGIGALSNTSGSTVTDRSTTARSSSTASDSQSRNHMPPPPAPLIHRNHSVLGGGQLRPLTSSNSVIDVNNHHHHQQQQQHENQQGDSHGHTAHHNNAPHRTYTGDFHHAGW